MPPITPAAQQDDDIFSNPLFSCFESQLEYIAMWEALEADLAGLGGIDDVEDMLDDEGFLQLLSHQEVSVPPTFVTLDNFLCDSWLSLLLIIFKYRCNWSQMCDGSPDLHRQQREEQDDCIYSFVHWSCCAPQKRLESASYSGYFARRRCFF